MRRVVEILALISIAVILISVALLPWPANIIIGGMLVAAIVVDSFYSWQAKKRQQETSLSDPKLDTPPEPVIKSTNIDFPYS